MQNNETLAGLGATGRSGCRMTGRCTERGIGLGAEFRAQTDENSYLRLGVFSVKDRLFGTGDYAVNQPGR